jgi:putative SOS response-associated peptidase YedK
LTAAGIWDRWKNGETGETLLSCSMIITEPRYFRERGFNRVIMAAEFFYHWPRSNSLYEVMRLPRQFNDVAKGKVRTFGAALSRARELELAAAD